MRVNVRNVADVAIVDLEGDLVLGDGDEILRETVDDLLSKERRKILLNLERVGRLDSAGVGEIVAGWRLARRFDASVKLLRPGDRVRCTLHLCQLLPLIELHEHEDAALASFVSCE